MSEAAVQYVLEQKRGGVGTLRQSGIVCSYRFFRVEGRYPRRQDAASEGGAGAHLRPEEDVPLRRPRPRRPLALLVFGGEEIPLGKMAKDHSQRRSERGQHTHIQNGPLPRLDCGQHAVVDHALAASLCVGELHRRVVRASYFKQQAAILNKKQEKGMLF